MLLKAGLSLAQIATLLAGDDQEPLLSELLTLQLESWKSRRVDAERGQRLVEAALERQRDGKLPSISANLARLGAIQSITFQGVGSAGWDVYDVRHESGNSRFRIMLRADGLSTGALFMVKDGPISVGP